ncbi:DDE-type integrase/transposase/recombinase [Lichenihabitans sp. Uapishka_5]|uniref:DDE-type integrase/transposase/recombinase n=1 Tax=Lichenihabitans sp. Uapishka_5 TaxID=3037302 RepID=UPI0029E7ED34|nr:DDE-type integrase/transposase/recombinase [Lichenihabitans sp. Uapishka_5]MDX7952927.1 DDE-type integrase/transposase/recombinase [Lichenihabitans sp. Uapishka_5]
MKLNFGEYDRITIADIAYRYIRSTDTGNLFERLDQPGMFESFSDVALITEKRAGFRYEKDWFKPGYAAARLDSGVGDLYLLPPEEWPEILYRWDWCRAFQALANKKQASRSDAGLKAAIERLDPGIQALVIQREKIAAGRAEQKKRAGALKIQEGRDAPSPKTLLRWLRRFREGNFCVTALRKRHYRSGNFTFKLAAEADRLLTVHAVSYASETRPTKTSCHLNLQAAIDQENAKRRTAGLEEIPCPSRKTMNERIDGLNAFMVHAARYGLKAAERKFAMLGQGLDVSRAGERVEMDEWSIQLMTLLTKVGLAGAISDEQKAKLKRIRVWVCVAIDCASRCILGMSVSRQPSTASAIATLHMVVRDKAAYADAVGALSPWDMRCTPETVVTDGGSTLIADAFRAKVLQLRSTPQTSIAGEPGLRGTMERVYRTIHTQLIARFTGRTFEHTVARGDYNAEARASLELDALLFALPRYVVDIYHNSPHEGLAGETPANAWRRLAASPGVVPPPGSDVCRNIFGTEVERRTGRHGVTVLNLDFASDRLHAHRRAFGDGPVKVKVDALDLGRVSVLLGDDWFALDCRLAGFAGVSMATWLEAAADIRRRHAADYRVNEHVVLEAVRAINAIAARGIERFGLGETRPSQASIDRAERDLAIGFRMPDLDGAGTEGDPADILADGVDGTGPGSPRWTAARSLPAPDRAPRRMTGIEKND